MNTNAKAINKIFDITNNSPIFALLNAIIPVGALIGTMLSGIVMNKFSRIHALIFTDIIAILSSWLQIIEWIYSFFIARLLCGMY